MMVRNFTNRVLGGVCGGLAKMTPFSAGLWRILFVLLALVTQGAGIAVYLLLWWMMPLPMPSQTIRFNLSGVLGLLLAIGLLIAWFMRDAWQIGAFYWPATLTALAFIFLLSQITSNRQSRTNVAAALVVLAMCGVWLIISIDATQDIAPNGILDLLVRSWPAVLVFTGLSIVLRDRLPLGNFVAIVVSIILVGGIAAFAYTSRVDEARDDQQITWDETIDATVNLLQVNVEALDTGVEFFSAAPADARYIAATYTGSNASEINPSYDETDGIATLTLREVRAELFPPLDQIGRGTLRVELPQNLALAVAFEGANGDITFDLDQTHLERLTFVLQQGSALVTLPEYDPQSATVRQNPGALTVFNGNLRILAPENIDGQFVLNKATNQRPQFNDVDYFLEDNINEWILRARRSEGRPVIRYIVNVPNGSLRLDVVETSSTANSDAE